MAGIGVIPPSAGGGGGGAVASVNSKTGAVVLSASDVGAQPAGNYAPLAATTDPRLRTDRAARGFLIAGNCYSHCMTSTSSNAGTAETRHPVLLDATDIRLVYTNWTVANPSIQGVDTDGPNGTFTIKASIKDAAGNIYRVTFGGSQTATIDPGGTVVSDPVAIEVSAGTDLLVRTYQPAGTFYPTGAFFNGTAGALPAGGFTAATDLTAPGSAAIAAGSGYVYQPTAILGTPTSRSKPTVATITDSIGVGYGEPAQYTDRYKGVQTGGFIHEALTAAGVPWISLGHGGEQVTNAIVAANHFRRHALIGLATHCIDETGINDIFANRTLAQVQADKIALWLLERRRGVIPFQTTITPETTSTDNWTTLANQTLKFNDAVRTGFNDWLRGGAPVASASNLTAVAVGTTGALLAGQAGHPLGGYFEIADQVESARNSGKWDTSRVITVADASITSGSQVLTTATSTPFTAASASSLMLVQIPGAGAGGGLLQTIIQGFNNTKSVNCQTAAGTTVSGVTAYINCPTFDGIHPGKEVHMRMAQGIDTTKLVLPF